VNTPRSLSYKSSRKELLHQRLYAKNATESGEKNMIEATSKIYEHAENRIMLYLPTELGRDRHFPFKIGEKVKVTIDAKNKQLVGKKLEKKGA